MLRQMLSGHWRGTIGIVAALWVLIAGRLLLWTAMERTVGWTGIVLWAAIGISLIVLIWQVVGTTRAADGALRDRDMPRAAIGYAAILIASLATAEQSFRLIAGTHVPAAYVPPATGVTLEGDRLTLSSEITFKTFEAIEQHLTTTDVTALDLVSDGGLVHAARGIARLVEEADLETRAIGPCRSACTLVFLAGSPRNLGPDGTLGFHSYGTQPHTGVGQIELSDPEGQLARDLFWMQSRGVSPDFTARIAMVPHNAMWHPDHADLTAAGVLRSDGADETPQ